MIFQLRYLKDKLHAGAAKEMQGVYPEGFVFLNVLYGLSWIEVAESISAKNELFEEAHSEINWVLSELASEDGFRVFEPNLDPAFGVFYKGWTNYLLGRKLKLIPAVQRDSIELLRFRSTTEEIVSALTSQESPFLESYSRLCWPADMVVAMASVSLSSRLGERSYEKEIANWLEEVKAKTDSLGLIPHSSEWGSGLPREPARGSSQSLILVFLFEIDEAFAREQFAIYKQNFLDYRFGLPGLREYPEGMDQDLVGDIDSGPVIWGIGGAASLVGQKTMAIYGESAVAIGIRNSIETFGLGNSRKGKKSYLMGKLPIADAFIAWSNSSEAYEEDRLTSKKLWRMKIQLISICIVLLGGFIVFRIW
ncbi:MAG: hypothetical protein AB8H47_17505 [Bacteroidia bacterium]